MPNKVHLKLCCVCSGKEYGQPHYSQCCGVNPNPGLYMTTTWICWLLGYVTHVRIYNPETKKFSPAQTDARCCCWRAKGEVGEEKEPSSFEVSTIEYNESLV